MKIRTLLRWEWVLRCPPHLPSNPTSTWAVARPWKYSHKPWTSACLSGCLGGGHWDHGVWQFRPKKGEGCPQARPYSRPSMQDTHVLGPAGPSFTCRHRWAARLKALQRGPLEGFWLRRCLYSSQRSTGAPGCAFL